MTYYAGKNLAQSFRTVRKNTIQLAHDIPEDQYGFRAAPNTRSVAEALTHIAASSRWQLKFHGDKKTAASMEDFGAYMKEGAAYEATIKTKADIVKALETNGDAFATWLESVPESALAETIHFHPPLEPSTKSRFEVILGVKEHEMHHRGQLMVVERVLGIVPHLTKAREQRMAPAKA